MTSPFFFNMPKAFIKRKKKAISVSDKFQDIFQCHKMVSIYTEAKYEYHSDNGQWQQLPVGYTTCHLTAFLFFTSACLLIIIVFCFIFALFCFFTSFVHFFFLLDMAKSQFTSSSLPGDSNKQQTDSRKEIKK